MLFLIPNEAEQEDAYEHLPPCVFHRDLALLLDIRTDNVHGDNRRAFADRLIRAVLIDRNDRFIGGGVFDERGILGYRVELSDRLVINH